MINSTKLIEHQLCKPDRVGRQRRILGSEDERDTRDVMDLWVEVQCPSFMPMLFLNLHTSS